MGEIKIIGYFVDTHGDRTYAGDVFVAIDEVGDHNGNLQIYCPIGQHCVASPLYIKECEELTKEEYLKASDGYYTPAEYV